MLLHCAPKPALGSLAFTVIQATVRDTPIHLWLPALQAHLVLPPLHMAGEDATAATEAALQLVVSLIRQHRGAAEALQERGIMTQLTALASTLEQHAHQLAHDRARAQGAL